MDPKYKHALALSFKAIFYFHTFYVTFCLTIMWPNIVNVVF